MENKNNAPEVKERVVYPKHWRRTFAVPLNETERAMLEKVASADGKALATWIRTAALAVAEIQLAADADADAAAKSLANA